MSYIWRILALYVCKVLPNCAQRIKSMMSEYSKTDDGEAMVVPLGKLFALSCCECGFTHDYLVSYDKIGRNVIMVVWVDPEETEVQRKYMKKKKIGIFEEKE